MRKTIFRSVIIGLNLLLLIAVSCFAGIESNLNWLKGPFSNGANFTTQDKKFSDPAWATFFSKSVKSTVALQVLDQVKISGAFTYAANLEIQYYTAPGSSATTVYQTLTVNYIPGQGAVYKGLDTYNIPVAAYKVVVTVNGSTITGTVPTGAVQLSTGIVIDRSYPFVSSTNIAAIFTKADNDKQLRVKWNKIPSADEYDMEWTTINNGNSNFTEISNNASEPSTPNDPVLSAALAAAFRNNASRITTTDSSLSVSLITTDSLLLIRVRQVQYDPSTGIRVAGDWDYKNGSGYAIWRLNWNEQQQNWQYSAAFAEDGKKKEVISYFDGTLRGRQTVTLNNSDNIAVAQENIYDDFGRPTASILPAPYKEPALLPYLHYIGGFSKNAADTAYTFQNIVGTTAPCEFNPDPLNTSAGASRYYSSHNDFLNINRINNYIPDAAGFPLSVTQYTNDNTGRIKSQGGVGLAFQPGKSGSPMASRTTKYYYGKPEQWELDQLFANDAGYAEHYLKNMVVDPNGQISISYLNASGKTIATALTGKAPAMLDSLPSYQPVLSTTKPQNIHVLKPAQFIYNNSSLTINASTTYLASVTGTDTLKFDIQRLVNHYPGTFQLCSNCYYKMTARVSDDCGNIAAEITTPLKIGDTTANCTDTTTYKNTLVVPVSQIGEYHVNIQLAFDPSVITSYTDTFIKKGIDSGYLEPQFDYIKKRYLDSINVSGCYSDCHTCITLLGSQSAFVQTLKDQCTALGLDSTGVAGSAFSTWAGGLYTTLKNNCLALQASCSYAPCNSVQDIMIADVSPGGQYALFDGSGTPMEPEINVLSQTLTGATDPNWRVEFPILLPKDSLYIRHQFSLPDGTITSPNDAGFTLQDLITYWQPSWAMSFLKYHPEYCKLKFCISNAPYESWDMRVQQDFNKAADVQLIPSAGDTLHYSYTNGSDWLLDGDPFFKSPAPGHGYIDSMRADLNNYSQRILHITPNKGLMAFKDYLLYCQDPDGNTNTSAPTDTAWLHCTPNNTCRVADREWTTYRQYYFDLKQKYYNILRNDSCGSACPVGQPVTAGLPGPNASCPTINDFSVQLSTDVLTCGVDSQAVAFVHNSGSMNRSVVLSIYYDSVYEDPSLIHNVFLNTGQSQQSVCLPSYIPVNAIHINAVDCGGSHYGNDPSYVVEIHDSDIDAEGDEYSYRDACGRIYTVGVNGTVITLTDDSGKPVIAVNPVTVQVKYSILNCGDTSPQDVIYDLIIDPGQSTYTLKYPTLVNCATSCGLPNTTSVRCVVSLTNASNINVTGTGLSLCDDYTYSNPQPPVNPCPAAYTTKQSRFSDVNSTYAAQAAAATTSTQLTTPMHAAIHRQADDICTANAETWLQRLQTGLDSIGATSTQISTLKAALINICATGGDQTHPMGASSLPPGYSGQYNDFGAAIKSIILSGGNFTTNLNPWLIEAPYPYTVQQQAVAKTLSNTNTAICDTLASLNSKAVTAGQTLYNYLVSTYGSAMTLTAADVDTLQKSCSNCRFILGNDVTLPVFLDPGAQGCITRAMFNAAKDSLVAQFGGSLSTTDVNYQTIFSNYMNLKWGFSLTYDDYHTFDTGSAPSLCNTLPYTSVNADPYDCVKNAVSTAVNSGLADYAAYIDLNRQKFRADYINTCKAAQANAHMLAVQQEYHYTLYYYDQADNLVRTVPPEGIRLVNPGLFNYIDRARDIDTAAYSWTYNGPTSNSSLSMALTTLSNTLSGAHGAVEMWLYNNGADHYHWVESTTDRKYLYQVSVAGTKLNIDVYPSSETTSLGVPTAHLLPATGHYQADISSLLPLLPFTHVVMQGDSLGSGHHLPQLYLNGHALTVSTSGTPSPFGFSIKAGTSSITYPDSIQHLKHLRLYDHVLSADAIMNDANDRFFNAADVTYTGWYRFNTPAVGAPPTTINATTSDETAIYDIYPNHGLLTTYAYNSTNQVNLQRSPDGGINRYWYDLLSRLTISQNDKQNPNNNYSYTKYDDLGRITEVGQKNQTTVSIGNPDYLTGTQISSFNAAGTNSQITHTWYDEPVPTVSGHTDGIASLPQQSNLRKRVAASTYAETQAGPVLRATYYNYDLDGNVKTLWQQVNGLYIPLTNAGLKRIDYEYDLVSGKVNFVRYQAGMPDAFYYKYNYDDDNRLTQAWSGTRAITDTLTHSTLLPGNGKLDASYQYYLHGPLARMELGDTSRKVQGVDYAYTLQGWLKGVNSSALQSSLDMGRDSLPVARDAYGYSLGYYTNDYSPIGGSSYKAFALKYTASTGDITGQSLYNGNISNSTLAIQPFNSGATVGYTYHYDQLNRLKKTRQHTGISGSSWDKSSITLNYQENAAYDGNGNILTYGRNGALPTAQTIDSLTYNYNRDAHGNLLNNQLNYIHDAVANSNYSGDLTNQSANNYAYDPTGNLIQDTNAGITNIKWSVYGKIDTISKGANNIIYTYNPAGQRVTKTTGGLTTYYVRDAQGNPLALYDNAGSNINWKEQQLYGSSRLGMWQPNVKLGTDSAVIAWDTVGRRQYELTNHLGNVLATVSDKRLQHISGSSIDYFTSDVITAQDYYPFGMLQPGRQYTASNPYRYGFNSKENDNEVKGVGNQQDYGLRIYDPRSGRFLSIDPITKQYPALTPYQFASNSPVKFIDLDGKEAVEAEGESEAMREEFEREGELEELHRSLKSPTNEEREKQAEESVNFWRQNINRIREVLKDLNDNLVENTANALGNQTTDFREQMRRYSMKNGGGTFVVRNFKDVDVMSQKSWFKYQGQINKISGDIEYEKNGVRFDGFNGKALLEAKGNYQWLFNTGRATKTEVYGNMQRQLSRQISAARGAKVEWHFAEESTMNEFKSFLSTNPKGKDLAKKVDLIFTKPTK